MQSFSVLLSSSLHCIPQYILQTLPSAATSQFCPFSWLRSTSEYTLVRLLKKTTEYTVHLWKHLSDCVSFTLRIFPWHLRCLQTKAIPWANMELPFLWANWLVLQLCFHNFPLVLWSPYCCSTWPLFSELSLISRLNFLHLTYSHADITLYSVSTQNATSLRQSFLGQPLWNNPLSFSIYSPCLPSASCTTWHYWYSAFIIM